MQVPAGNTVPKGNRVNMWLHLVEDVAIADNYSTKIPRKSANIANPQQNPVEHSSLSKMSEA